MNTKANVLQYVVLLFILCPYAVSASLVLSGRSRKVTPPLNRNILHISSQLTSTPHLRPPSDCPRLRFNVLLDLVRVINVLYCIVFVGKVAFWS